jgi:hypothetical protein
VNWTFHNDRSFFVLHQTYSHDSENRSKVNEKKKLISIRNMNKQTMVIMIGSVFLSILLKMFRASSIRPE